MNRTIKSQLLFRYLFDCAKAKYGRDGIKVREGYLGKLIGVDASFVSNWKKGKREVLDAERLLTIARDVDADIPTVLSIVDGNIPPTYTREAKLMTARASGGGR